MASRFGSEAGDSQIVRAIEGGNLDAKASPDTSAARSRSAISMAAVLSGYMILYVLAWSVFPDAGQKTALNLLNFVGPLVATALLALAAKRAHERRLKFFWGLLAAAALLSALGEATYGIYESILGVEAPYPSTADVFWLLSYPLKFIAIMSLLSFGRKSRLEIMGVGLEAVVLALATGMLVWQYIMLPSLDMEASVLSNLVSVLYPGGDVLLLAALSALTLLPQRGRMPRGLTWIAASFVVDIIADLAYSVYVLRGTYETGSWIDPLWPLAYTLLAAAAAWQFARPHPTTAAYPEAADPTILASPLYKPSLRDQFRVCVPYAAIPVAAWVIYASFINDGQPAYLFRTVPLIVAFFLAALILSRQFITVLENRRLQATLTVLSRDLESRVVQRTSELSLLNHVAVAMSHCSTSRQVIAQGLELAKETLDCEATGLCLRLPGSRQRFYGSVGLGKPARVQLREAAQRACKEAGSAGAAQSDMPAVLALDYNDAAGGSTRRASRSAAAQIRTPLFDRVVVAPLVSRHASFGGLCLASRGKTIEESQSQLDLISAVTAQIAVALENARRFEEAHYLAHRDPVTGLLNHRGMNARLEQECARCHRVAGSFSVVMMDLDSFKLFNDTYGHAVGDDVLNTVARVLHHATRTSDIVSRYGGDEFMALLPDTTAEGAVVLVKRIQQEIKDRAFYFDKPNKNQVPIALSFGIANYPNEGVRLAEVLSAADANLYRSKQKGGDEITAPNTDLGPTEKLGAFNVLEGLVTTVDNKDHYTRRHSDDVCQLSVALAMKLGLSHETQRVLRVAGLLHDVGKIGVPDSVLRKPSALDADEFEVVKQHVTLGRLIIRDVPNLSEVLDAVATHHERLDGAGYPEGLKGKAIPLLGRILAVADAYSAMTTDRPYRKALAIEDAIAELRKVAGKQLDPMLVKQFIKVVECRKQESGTETTRMTA
jgi:diguanylate cyclase (GGDEF)-like protein